MATEKPSPGSAATLSTPPTVSPRCGKSSASPLEEGARLGHGCQSAPGSPSGSAAVGAPFMAVLRGGKRRGKAVAARQPLTPRQGAATTACLAAGAATMAGLRQWQGCLCVRGSCEGAGAGMQPPGQRTDGLRLLPRDSNEERRAGGQGTRRGPSRVSGGGTLQGLTDAGGDGTPSLPHRWPCRVVCAEGDAAISTRPPPLH